MALEKMDRFTTVGYATSVAIDSARGGETQLGPSFKFDFTLRAFKLADADDFSPQRVACRTL